MQNENEHAYICEKCKEITFLDFDGDQNCANCGNEMIQLPITKELWDSMPSQEKEDFLNETIHKSKKYSYKNSCPLAWHKWMRIVSPLILILNIVNIFNSNNIVLNILYIIESILIAMFFIGSFSWKEYAWYGIVIYDSVCIIEELVYCIFSNYEPMYIALFLFGCIINGLQMYYYTKRKKLFNNSKEDTNDIYLSEFIKTKDTINNNINNESEKTQSIITNNLDKLDTNVDANIFCTECGTKLPFDAKFCQKCGKKIIKY